ncbi:MAG: hypothetical protein KAX20_03755, partial [Candidatus Omnitrophica bacterium]|nr:hypothetical protein [Candidatus Omnitrophota bacterium]
FDFVNPREIGMTAYFLDRGRKRKRGESVKGEGRKSGVKVKKEDKFVISDLNEILDVFVR